MKKVKIWFDNKDADANHRYMVSLGYAPYEVTNFENKRVQAWYGHKDGSISWCYDRNYFTMGSSEFEEIFLPELQQTASPIGLRPKAIVDVLRIKEILEAMTRYSEAGEKIPQEWLDELSIINSEKA